MKVVRNTKETKFSPITLTITIETKEELHLLQIVKQYFKDNIDDSIYWSEETTRIEDEEISELLTKILKPL